MVTLETPSGANGAGASAIDDSGRIVGVSSTGGVTHVVLWAAGGVEDLGVTPANKLGLGANGEVWGTRNDASGHRFAFVWTAADGVTDLALPGDTDSTAEGIDGSGRVAGTSVGGGINHGFVWTRAGGFVRLDVPGATSTSVVAISKTGQVIGQYVLEGNNNRAFSWTPAGGMVELGTLGGHASYAGAVAPTSGEVIGISTPANEGWDTFSWTQGGGMRDIGPDFGAMFVNDSGEILAQTEPYLNDWHVLLWTGAEGAVDIGGGNAMALNNRGEAVGSGLLVVDTTHAWVWTQTDVRVDLGPPGQRSWAYDINERGEIVGAVEGTDGQETAVLWEPLDTTAPTLTLPGSISVETTSASGAVARFDVSAKDDLDPSPVVSCAPASGSLFAVGDTTVQCSASDVSGNTGHGSFVVHIRLTGGGGGGSTTTTSVVTTTPMPAPKPPPAPTPPPVAPAPTPPVTVVKPVIAKPVIVPRTLRAGKAAVVSFKITRSDNHALLRTGRMICDPSVSGRVIRHREQFRNGTATLRFTIPKTAKHKVLKVRVTIRLGARSTTRISTFRVH